MVGLLKRWMNRGVLLGTFVIAARAVGQDDGTRPLCESVLPATTRAFVSADDTRDVFERWDRTRLGQLMDSAEMQPFVEEVYNRLQEVWLEGHQRLGLEWADVRDVPTGQVALGYVHEPDTRPAVVLWMDVKGNVPAAEAMLAKVRQNLIDQGAKRGESKVGDVTMVTYTVPPREGSRRNDKAVHFLKDDVLVVAGSVPLAEQLLKRWDGPRDDGLAVQESFQAVFKRCERGAVGLTPQFRWFIDPFPLVDALKETGRSLDQKEDEIDVLLALRNQGFDGVRGVGGFVHVGEGAFDVLHRTAVYVPQPRRAAMQMLTLPNAPLKELPTWVNDGVTSINIVNVDAQTGFEAFGKLYDELAGQTELGEDAQGLFNELIEALLDPEQGYNVDVRKEIVGKLGSRAMIISDYTEPITPESERALLAFEAKDPTMIAAALEKLFGQDVTFMRRVVAGSVVWEAVETTEDEEPKTADEAKDEFGIPRLHFAVGLDYFFVSTSFDIIKETLEKAQSGPRLADAEDFQHASRLLDELGADETCLRVFARTDQAHRVTYELIRQNRLREASSVLGRLANALLENESDAATETNAKTDVIDGSKLPAHEVVKQYVGPSGIYAVTEDDGWYVVGFVLGKNESVAENQAAEGDATAGAAAADSVDGGTQGN